MAERGIEYLFANAGTDFAPIVEAYAKAAHTGLPAPKPLIATHENLAMSMAHGYAIASGKVPAVMVHVSVGTANALCGVFNAARECVPILVTAGRSPLTEEGVLGARDTYIHWAQEMFDQAGMLRELVKWEYELRNGTQLETVIDRALSLATSAPQGPVYLSLPREVLAEKLAGFSYDSPSRRAAVASPGADDAAVAKAAEILANAKRPVIVTASAGRDPAAVAVLAEFAERFAIPVVEHRQRHLSLSADHPCHLGYDPTPFVKEADAILVIESRCAVGAEPGVAAGRLPRRPYRRRPAVQPLSDPGLSLRCRDRRAAAAGAAEAERGTEGCRKRRSPRGGRRSPNGARPSAPAGANCARRWRRRRRSTRPGSAIASRKRARPTRSSSTNTRCCNEHCGSTLPGSYFGSSPAAGLGWGAGAALGVKLAEPGGR